MCSFGITVACYAHRYQKGSELRQVLGYEQEFSNDGGLKSESSVYTRSG